MNGLRGWKIAKIRGVDLKIHISLLFLVLYIVIVASAQFPLVVQQSGIDPASLSGGPIIWSLVFALALFTSVVLHEFGHVFMAQSLGVKVKGVTLMMLGGVSEMEKMPELPYAEFKLSIVGPIVSFALAGLLLLIGARTGDGNLAFFSFWLGRVNLVLAIFNLLPAFPLDGGRALRSLLSARQGITRGTQNAVKISKGFAWGLGILGFLGFNILLMIIAFFIYTAANSELFMLLSREALRDTLAGEVGVRTDVLSGGDTLGYAAEKMISSRNRILPVRLGFNIAPGNGTVNAGLVSIESLRRIPREQWGMVQIQQILQESPRVVDVSEKVSQIIPELAASTQGAFPLSDQGVVVGVIRQIDLSDTLQFLTLELAKEREKKRAA